MERGRKRTTQLAILSICIAVTALTAQSRSSSVRRSESYSSVSGSGVMSPTVVGSWVAHPQASFPAAVLDLLVLWRGSPAWWKGSYHASSGGGRANAMWLRMRYGDMDFDIDLDRSTGSAKILDRPISIGDANVILMDNVDAAGGPKLVEKLKVDPAFTDPHIETIIRRSPKLQSFMQCDIQFADQHLQEMMQLLCARMRGGQQALNAKRVKS